MRWLEARDPLRTWAIAQARPTPPRGRVTLASVGTCPVRSAEWLAVSADTGGWVYLDEAERNRLLALPGRVGDAAEEPALEALWRRGLVRIDDLGVLDGLDHDAAVSETREHYTLILLLSAGCNLACSYCYLGHAKPSPGNALNPTLARAAIRSALHQPWPTVVIDFGEIAAATPVLRELVEFALAEGEVAGKCVRPTIQTNGTTISPEVAAFLGEHDVAVGISLDGPAALHNRARVLRSGAGTHAQARLGIQHCLDAGVDVHLIATIGRHNIDHPAAVVAELAAVGARSFLLKPVLAEGEAGAAWDREGVPAERHADFMRAALAYAEAHGAGCLDQSATKFLQRALGDRNGWRESCTSRHCGSGRSLHVLTPAGELHACPRFVEEGAGLPIVSTGHGNAIPGEVPLPDLLNPALRAAPTTCAGCPWLPSCGGGCTLVAQDGPDDAVPRPDPHCVTHMAVHEELFKRVVPAYLDGADRTTTAFNGALVRQANW